MEKIVFDKKNAMLAYLKKPRPGYSVRKTTCRICRTGKIYRTKTGWTACPVCNSARRNKRRIRRLRFKAK